MTAGERDTYARLARIHDRTTRRRHAWLRNMACQLGTFEHVAFENLNVTAMTRTARGTVENPGRNVAAKSGLNRAILNAGWGYLRTWTSNKTHVVKVRAARTSQECRACGHAEPANRPDRDTFCCVQCGHTNHADLNASDNIEARGTRVLLEPGTPGPSVAAHRRKSGRTKTRQATTT